jgi:radical SAM superfamily enzyme YgiQ (UPF0313 family)
MSLWYPKWLAYTTGLLEREGHKVCFIDSTASKTNPMKELELRAKQFRPELVVCDSSTAGFSYEVGVCSKLKYTTGAKIVMVGTHVSALPEECLKYGNDVDFIAVGEYDFTILELANVLETGGNLKSVKGIVYRRGEDIIHNDLRPLIANLDDLPFVTEVYQRHLNISDYSLDFLLHPYVDLMCGRGCPYRCSYCLWPQTLMGRKYRTRSLDNIFLELDYILRTLNGIKEIFFDDDTFTANRNRIKEFCTRVIDDGYDFKWSLNCRPDVIDKELVNLMAKAGCRLAVVGYESGSQQILDNVKKGTDIDSMRKFTKLFKSARIKIHGDFMIGLPGETRETVQETIYLAKQIMPDTFQISIATPYPGTEFYSWLNDNSYLISSNFDEWLDEDGQQRCVISYPNLSADEMKHIIKNAVTGYYLNPVYLFHASKVVLKDRDEFKRYAIGGKGFVKQLYRWHILRK